jgi:arylsulfatase A-like enzyme
VSYVPPGWDEFLATQPDKATRDSTYYNYRLRGTADNSVHYADAPEDYSTDVLADVAANVVVSAPADQPLFLYFAPYAVHPPWTPAPRDVGTWPLEPETAIPALDEANVTDKPRWVRRLPRVDRSLERLELTKQHEMSMSLDDAIEKITLALGDRAADTMFIYMSDNGFMHGSHRIHGKNVPYAWSTEVPIAIKWPGLATGTDSRIVTNVDLSATIAEAAGVPWNRDGRSVLSTDRTGTVVEQVANSERPAYCGWRTKRYLFTQYDTGEQELYDYRRDPNELHNRAAVPRYAAKVAALQAEAQQACTPVPPGFAW